MGTKHPMSLNLSCFIEPRSSHHPFVLSHTTTAPFSTTVATLALGSRPRQRACKVANQEKGSSGVKAKALQGCGPRGSRGVTLTYSRECKKMWGSVREWTLTLPRQLPFWEMESRWTPETSESDCRGQTSISYGVLYIIGKLLEHRCLKWARIAHLDIWNTSYGQKKGRESNCQFDSRPQKVENRPDLLAAGGVPYIVGKLSMRAITLLRTHCDPRSARKVMGLQSRGSPIWRNPEKNSHLDVVSVESCRVYYKGEGASFPQVWTVVSFVCPCCPWFVLARRVL